MIYLVFWLIDVDFCLYYSDLLVYIKQYQYGNYAHLIVVNNFLYYNSTRNNKIVNLLLIVEVLSISTKASNKEEKLKKYRSLFIFSKYLLFEKTLIFI